MMEQYEKDKEIERLNKVVSRLEELLSVSETQYTSVEQIVEHLQKQLDIATKALKEYSWGNNWLDAGCRGQVFLPTKKGHSIADKALDEMEEA